MNFLHEPPALLISGIFLIQVFSISFYISRVWLQSRERLLHNYPDTTFPNLYPQTRSTELTRLTVRRWLDSTAGAVGSVLLVFLHINQATPDVIGQWMICMALIQLQPMLLSAYWCNQNAQRQSRRFPDKIRAARLSRNRLTEHVSFSKIIISVILFVGALTFGFYQHASATENSSKFMALMSLSVAVALYVGFRLCVLLYGKKTDNFISSEEREIKLANKLNRMILWWGVYNGFLVIIQGVNYYSLSEQYVVILASLLAQVIAYTTRNQYYPINPAVYK